ncbi:MAG: hypothetical protein LBP88_00480 [Treponema sp.]|jgi:raffinose/stachyose/melibiose transport system permease protein|nr:hypothetical protein [Treponema sp.]
MADYIRPKKRYIFMYLCIPISLFIFTVIVPVFQALFYSFFKWTGGPNKTFTGLANYLTLAADKLFWQAFGHNLFLVAACILGHDCRGG